MFSVRISFFVFQIFIILKISNADEEVSVCGAKCATTCTQGSSYRWCGVWSNSKYGKWDYCSWQGLTISGERCKTACQKKDRTSYYWCETSDSWNYCSPSKASGHSYNCTGTSGWIIFGVICGVVVAIVCCAVSISAIKSCCWTQSYPS